MHHRVRGVVLGTIAALSLGRVAHAEGEEPAVDAATDAVPAAAEPASQPVEGAAPAPPPAAADEPKFTWVPYGYLRLQYRVIQNDPNVQFVGRDDGFELQNARVGVKGTLGTRMRFGLAIDGAVDERAQVNVPEGKLRVGLKDAWVDAMLAGATAVRAGFFETFVDPDLDDDTAREFIDKPIESRGVRPTQGFQADGLPPGRSLGAAVRLDPEAPKTGVALGFEVAVQNGTDEYAADNDNDTPAVSASALARLPHAGWIVASARFNRRTVDELPLRKDEDDLQGSLGARFAAGPVALHAGAVFQRTSFPTTGGPVQNGYGAHAALTFTVPGTLPLAVGYRFGLLDPSSLILTDRVIEHTAGGVLGVPAYRMRLQLQVVHVAEQGARTLANDRVQLAAEVSL